MHNRIISALCHHQFKGRGNRLGIMITDERRKIEGERNSEYYFIHRSLHQEEEVSEAFFT